MKRIVVFFAVVFTALICGAETFGASMPSGSGIKIEDFEQGYVWVHAGEDWDRWGGHHVSSGAELARKWKSSGKYSMMFSYDKQTGEDKAVWYTDYPAKELLDISSYNYIVMDIYNPESHPLVLGLCMQDKDWNWLQSDTWCWFPHGEHTLVYDISSIPRDKRAMIARLMFMQPNPTPSEGCFFVDNIRGYR